MRMEIEMIKLVIYVVLLILELSDENRCSS